MEIMKTSLHEGANFATYYFKHESEEDEISSHDDIEADDASLEKSLNYSKEEVQLLARRAEEMILSNVKYESLKNCNDQSEADTSDSDYGSRASREWFVSSEPNITQRRMSPQRKLLKSRRKDWRHSLPECLEYSPLPLPGPLLKTHRGSKECDFKETKRHLGNHGSVPGLLAEDHNSAGEFCVAKSTTTNSGSFNILNFGENYADFLSNSSDTNESIDTEASITRCSSVNFCRKRRARKHVTTIEETLKQSDRNLRNAMTQVRRRQQDMCLQISSEYETILKVCQKNLNILMKKSRQPQSSEDHWKCIKNLARGWKKLRDEVEDLLEESVEFLEIQQIIGDIKDDLKDLTDEVEDAHRFGLAAEMGLTICKDSLLKLVIVKERMFKVQLSVHTLIHKMTKRKDSSFVSLVYSCKEEVNNLYEEWEEAHERVTDADRKYLKQRYSEHLDRSLSLGRSSSLGETIAELHEALDEMKTKVKREVTRKNGSEWSRFFRWGTMSVVSSLFLLSMFSFSYWLAPTCCDYHSSWQNLLTPTTSLGPF